MPGGVSRPSQGTRRVPAGAECRQGFLEGAIRQLPAHGQVIHAGGVLHDGLEIITNAGLERDGRRLLVGFERPLAGVGRGGHPGNGTRVARQFVAAQEQFGGVVTGDPESVSASSRRHDKGSEPLAVIGHPGVGGGLEVARGRRCSPGRAHWASWGSGRCWSRRPGVLPALEFRPARARDKRRRPVRAWPPG